MSYVLSVEGVVAGYDGTPVLRDFSLSVGAGEVVALLGANGAGKTTAVRAISGMIRPYSGSIQFGTMDVCAASPQRLAMSGLAHVPDSRGIFPALTVDEHFRLGSRRGGEAFRHALTYFPALEGLRRRRAALLSGGEQQMLALAAALARRPTLLLIDELSLGLAPIAVERLLPVVRDYATDTGAGVVIVEQHVHLALRICDRGLVLSHGEVVMRAERERLQADRRLLVASYLGEAGASSAVRK
jgi:branched-chain amino acid transport system ATP-binding protein